MKVEVENINVGFSIRLVAENMVDAAMLINIGSNATNDIFGISVLVKEDGSFDCKIVLQKRMESEAKQ